MGLLRLRVEGGGFRGGGLRVVYSVVGGLVSGCAVVWEKVERVEVLLVWMCLCWQGVLPSVLMDGV